MDDVINELKGLKDVHVELCGSWLWVSGDTKPHKDKLRALGLFWAPKKGKWYLKPVGFKSRRHKPVDMDKIRFKYGSELLV